MEEVEVAMNVRSHTMMGVCGTRKSYLKGRLGTHSTEKVFVGGTKQDPEEHHLGDYFEKDGKSEMIEITD